MSDLAEVKRRIMVQMIEDFELSAAFEDASILKLIYQKSATETEAKRFFKAFYQIKKKFGTEKDWIDQENIRETVELPDFDVERFIELQQEAYYQR